MTDKEKGIWEEVIERVLIENEPWKDKNKSERYHVVFKNTKMPPKVVLKRANELVDFEYPQILPISASGGVQTNQAIEQFGFKIVEDLSYNKSDFNKLKAHLDKKVNLNQVFSDFISFGSDFLSQLDIEVYKVRMAIEQRGIMTVIVGMRATYSYKEVDGFAQIGFLVSKAFNQQNKSKYNFVDSYDYKGDLPQDFVKVQVKNWEEIDSELLEEHINQFKLQYDRIKDTKRTLWNVEANTTNNALKYLMFKNENIDSFMKKDNIINIGHNKIYKLSMGIFYKNTLFRKANLADIFQSKNWAVMHRNTASGQGDIWLNDIKKEDYAYITFGKDKLSSIIQFDSDAMNLPESLNDLIGEEGYTYRSYKIIKEPIKENTRALVSDKRFWLPSGNSTLKIISDIGEANNILFQPYYNSKIVDFKTENNIKKLKDSFQPLIKNSTLNQILYGPPGTGKTFFLKEQLFEKYTLKEESISKEKYFEEVITNLTWWQVITLALIEKGKSKVSDILDNRWVATKASLSESKNVRATIWGTLQMHTIEESTSVNYKQRQAPLIFDKTENKSWELLEVELKEQAPEIYKIKDEVDNFQVNVAKSIKHYDFVTFHQSFSYEDFIEGIKPIFPENDEEASDLGYTIEDGVFKRLCLRAKNDPENRYAIFIDEINRGNVSAIFGELITLIETDKRSGAKNEMSIKLPYSKKEFSVPSNLDIYGTMNTADRSVEALDTALRRRFEFVEKMPDYKVIDQEEVNGVKLSKVLKVINKRIELLIDRDHTIGHSYFVGVDTSEKLANAFNNKIVPLLQEYFYGDYGKIGLVLGNGFVKEKDNRKLKFSTFKYEGKEDFITPTYKLIKVDESTVLNAVEQLLETNES